MKVKVFARIFTRNAFVLSMLSMFVFFVMLIWNLLAYDIIDDKFYKIYTPYISNIIRSTFVEEYIENIDSLNIKLSEDASMIKTPEILAFQAKMTRLVNYLRKNADGNKELILEDGNNVLRFHLHELSGAYKPPELNCHSKMIRIGFICFFASLFFMVVFAVLADRCEFL